MSARHLRIAAFAVVVAAVAFVVAQRQRALSHAAIWPGATLAHVPHLRGSITLDGDTDDPGWKGPSLRTGTWVGADGVTPVHPHSEARILWGDGFLYMNLYAADEDIKALSKSNDSVSADEDSFHVVFTDATTERSFDFTPLGLVTDAIRPRGSTTPPDRSWDSHVHVSHEMDGTANDPKDNDEEWVLEIAIPFESLGLLGAAGERIGLAMHRCDVLRKGPRVCGAWGEVVREVLVLDPP